MKIIDLLNKIANGEEVPKVIRFGKIIYEYEEGIDYVNGEGKDKKFLIDKICISQEDLNDEVEILDEEPKKIEKIEIYEDEDGHYFLNNRYNKIYIRCDETDFMADKFNELIDEINNLKEK